jgi:prepilin-type N-terminal cleavage/methylation domain-containing protein/prepilin-type processing-associated H-X9-DG protein
MRKQGFTLIELLVVIAIIAILAAILFPVFARARETAKKSACLSNMKQMSHAWIMYSDDYDGACPALFLDYRLGQGYYTDKHTTWMEELYPYIKSSQVFGCPSGGFVPKTPADLMSDKWDSIGRLTYGWNATVFNYPWIFPVSQSDLDVPSDTAFVCDTTGANYLSLPGPQSMYWNSQYDFKEGAGPEYIARPPANRHNGTINVAFCDGHARALAYNELVRTEDGNGRKVAIATASGAGQWVTSMAKEPVFVHFMVSYQRRHF